MFSLLDITCLILPFGFLPGLISGAVSTRWAILALLIPLMLWKTDASRVPHKWLLAGIFGYACISIAWMQVPLESVQELWHSALMVGAFAIGASATNIRRPLTLMAISLAASAPLVLAQCFGYEGVAQVAKPAGLFLNKNVLAELAAALLVASLFMREWLIAAVLAAIVFMAQEKAAYVALAVVAIVWLMPRKPFVAGAIFVAMIGVGSMLMYSPSATARFDIWLDTIQGMSFFGNGIGSFYTAFPAHASHMNLLAERPEHAHNEFLQYAFEFGAGAAMLGAVAVLALRGGIQRELELLIFVCILAESFFAFPLHMPATAFLAALVAGRLCRTEPDACDTEHRCSNQDSSRVCCT